MSVVEGLRCRECARDVDLSGAHVCEHCFGPLEVVYDRDEQRRRVSRAAIEAGPESLWRYGDLRPFCREPRLRNGSTSAQDGLRSCAPRG